MHLCIVAMDNLPRRMLPILATIIQVLSPGMLPILTNMNQGVFGQSNLEFAKDERILKKDDSDDGVLHVKFWLQTDAKIKSIHEDGVVTKLE